MTIKVGERVPSVTLKKMGEKGPENISTDDIFPGRKVVLFAVPGAFTPTCSAAHLPGYVINADKIKAKGVDTIVCMAVNDAFVMGAWGKAHNAEELLMLADGNAELSKALGLTQKDLARKAGCAEVTLRKIDPGERFPWGKLSAAGLGHFVAPYPVGGGRFLSGGDRGEPVEALQSMLALYGYDVEISGAFDAATQTIVAAFQRHFRPERVEGVADRSTIETLHRLLRALPALEA